MMGQFNVYVLTVGYYCCLAVVFGTFFFQGRRCVLWPGRWRSFNLVYLTPALGALAVLFYVVMPVEGSGAVLPPDKVLYGRVLSTALAGVVLGCLSGVMTKRLADA